MTDRRLTPANDRVADQALRDSVAAPRYVAGVRQRVIAPLADLLAAPGGARDRQLLMGDGFRMLETRNGFAFGQALRDGYVGYVREDRLGPDKPATHIVTAPATHLYTAPDVKAPEHAALSFGARLTVSGHSGAFARIDAGGFVPKAHLTDAATGCRFTDPVAVAEMFLGTPYLWGGNSRAGLDCSALIQIACLACGIACPGDSDLQCAQLGQPLPADARTQRGDIVFWHGHVGWMSDGRTLLHANAHHMSVTREPLQDACARIEAQGGGAPIAFKRIPPDRSG